MGSACRVLHVIGWEAVRTGSAEEVLELVRLARRRRRDDRVLWLAKDVPPSGDVPESSLGCPEGREPRAGLVRARIAGIAPGLLHVHDRLALRAIVAAGTRGCPVVASFHAAPEREGWLRRWRTRRAARTADVTAPTDWLAASVRAATGRDAEIAPASVDTDVYQPVGPDGKWRDRLGLPRQGLLFGHLASLAVDGWAGHLLDAFAEVHRRLPDAALVLEASTGAAPSPGSGIHVLGRIPDRAALLRALDVFVAGPPHLRAPRPLLEALATGRPVVATEDVRALVPPDQEPCALMARAGDPRRLASALVSLEDPTRRLQLGHAARHHALRRYALSEADTVWERFYGRRLRGRSAAAGLQSSSR